MKLNTRIIIYIYSILFFIYLVSLGWIIINARKNAREDTLEKMNITSLNYSERIKYFFESDMSIARTLAYGFSNYPRDTMDYWQKGILEIYIGILNKNPQINAIWDSWELNVIDKNWNKPTGRLSYNVWHESNQIKNKLFLKSLDGDPPAYKKSKKVKIEEIANPYFYSYSNDSLLITDLSIPMFENNKFLGLVGLDILLDRCKELIDDIKPFDEIKTTAFLASGNGTIFASSYKSDILKNIKDVYPGINKEKSFITIMEENDMQIFSWKNKNGEKIYTTYTSMELGNSNSKWYLGINLLENEIMSPIRKKIIFYIFVGFLSMLIIAILIFIIIKKTINPLTRITNVIKKIAKGHIDISLKMNYKSKDEIGEISNSVNHLIDGLNSSIQYAKDIGEGKFDSEYKLLSKKDALGNSLLEMKNSLKTASEKEGKRKIEDKKRNWASQGLATLAETQRHFEGNIKDFSNKILDELLIYIDANQGALYLINNKNKEDSFIEMMACNAFNRRKYQHLKVQDGEGLIGRCIQEKNMIYLKNIPESFAKYTSGLGDHNPSNLLILPLINNNQILGALEIISFNEFKQHVIDFITNACESIAASIASVKINIRTNQLLEKSRQQGEEMAAQEEEMRQNMEELQATQEESHRREKELLNYKEAMEDLLPMLLMNEDGTITKANNQFCIISQQSENNIIGSNLNNILKHSSAIDLIQIVHEFRSGVSKKLIKKIELESGNTLDFSLIPFKDNEERFSSILAIGIKTYKN